MRKKYFISLLLFALLIVFSCSYSFAVMGNSTVKNEVMNVGNGIGQAAVSAKNAVVTGVQDIGNGIGAMGNGAMNAVGNAGNGIANTLSMNSGNYTATRTATTNNNLLGLSNTAWTWLILGIVGIAIVGLVWYYGAQFEHKNYDHE